MDDLIDIAKHLLLHSISIQGVLLISAFFLSFIIVITRFFHNIRLKQEKKNIFGRIKKDEEFAMKQIALIDYIYLKESEIYTSISSIDLKLSEINNPSFKILDVWNYNSHFFLLIEFHFEDMDVVVGGDINNIKKKEVEIFYINYIFSKRLLTIKGSVYSNSFEKRRYLNFCESIFSKIQRS